MPMASVFSPSQAAEFSGSDRAAVAVYCPGWTELLLTLLQGRPDAYEAAWHFSPQERAHVLEVRYQGADPFHIALIDGMHNGLMRALTLGRALVLSPYPLYREEGWEGELFSPDSSLVLPSLPSLLDAASREFIPSQPGA